MKKQKKIGDHSENGTHGKIVANGRDQSSRVAQGSPVPTANGNGQIEDGVQGNRVAPNFSSNGSGNRLKPDIPEESVPTSRRKGNQSAIVIHQEVVPLPSLISDITEKWHQRQMLHRAEKSLTLQIRAVCRRACGGSLVEAGVLYQSILDAGDHPLTVPIQLIVMPLLTARTTVEQSRLVLEKELRQLATLLPGARFVVETPGISLFTLAAITGECPGLNSRGLLDFPTVAKVWKRMGVAVMPDGTRQRQVSGAAAIEHGFAPARRSVLWTIGDSLIKVQGPYRDFYLHYKEREREKCEAQGLTILPAAKIPPRNIEQYVSEGIVHARAKRKMEKQLLKELWVAVRREARERMTPEMRLSSLTADSA